MHSFLEFEKPIADLEGQIRELRSMDADVDNVDVGEEVTKLEGKGAQALQDIYKKLTPWQKM